MSSCIWRGNSNARVNRWGRIRPFRQERRYFKKKKKIRKITFSWWPRKPLYGWFIQKLGWIKRDSQRLIHKDVMLYNSLNVLALDYLSSEFVDRSSVSNYSLRDTKLFHYHTLTTWKIATFTLEQFFGISLPIDLRQADSLGAFRAGCERFLSSSEI